MLYDLIIVGGGPAGVAAAVYAARKRLKTLLLTESFGGQSIVSADIQNWIGEEHISGFDLAKKFEDQVRAFPDVVEIKMPEKAVAVSKINCLNPAKPGISRSGAGGSRICDFEVKTDLGNSYQGKAVILAAGARRRRLGVPGEDQLDGKGVAFCSTCLPPHEKIIANSSVKEISEIKRFQRVLTVDGSFQNVSRIMNRPYDGDLVEITTRFFTEPTLLTPNHPVLTVNITKGTGANYWRDFRISDPQWIPAGELTEKNAVLYPIFKDIKDVKKISLTGILDWGPEVRVVKGLADYRRGSPTSHKIPDEIAIDSDFMRLAGYFIAEGCLSGKGINFYFSKREQEYVDDVTRIVKKIFGLNTTLVIAGNVARIEIYSELIEGLFFNLFGKYAHNKRVPHWMLLLPHGKQAELVKGIYRGDGCKREKDFCIVTNSKTLAYQLRDILLRLGVMPSIQKRAKDKLNLNPGKIGERIIKFNHDKYHINVGGPSLEKMSQILNIPHEKTCTRNRISHYAWLRDRHIVLPIRTVKRIPYKGKVHNLSVEGNNTYVAKNFIVHNCDAPIFKNKVVAVVGGGNAGLEAVVDLFPYASKIYLLEFSDSLKGDPVTQKQIKNPPAGGPKVEIILNAQTKEILGESMVTGIKYLARKTNKEHTLQVQGVFVEIGSVPNSEMVKAVVELDKWGQVIIDSKHGSTSTPGIFAAGDITDDPYKQNNISAGDAVKAALAAYAYLLNREKQTPAAETVIHK